ncbi:MAG: hypothetical protein Kow0029_09650 [Candidatus Rifleibacteriota bacterium]
MSDATPMNITSIKKCDKRIEIELANHTKSARVHVIATRFIPDFAVINQLCNFSRLFPISMDNVPAVSKYLSGRNIGDEYKYILERKHARIFPGNMLKKPGLLLNPWSIQKTETQLKEAAAGDSWGGTPGRSPAAKARIKHIHSREKAAAGCSSFYDLEFLASGSRVFTNLPVDNNGLVVLNLDQIGPMNQIHVVAIDRDTTSCAEYSLDEIIPQIRDTRMARALDPKEHYSEQKNISLVKADETFTVSDLSTAKVEVFDSLSSVYRLLATINPDNKLAEFSFITNWNELSESQKLENYSKYSCHELNFFLYKKDREFFDKVVKPYIENKRDKTFLDNWFLNRNLEQYLSPWSYGRLNVVERILLAQKLERIKDNTSRHVNDLFDLLPVDANKFNHLFNTALKGSSLDVVDRLGIKGAIENALALPPAPQGSGRTIGRGFAAPTKRRSVRPSAKAFSREEKEMSEGLVSSSEADDFAIYDEPEEEILARDSERRKKVKNLFRQLDSTEEWVENNYYKLPIEQQLASLVTVNAFWRDYAANKPDQPFLSKNIAYASRNFTEMMFALSVLDLPFKPGNHESGFSGATMNFKAASNAIVFHREIKPVKKVAKAQTILTSQNFFDRNDRYYYYKNERFDKFVTDEFKTRNVYGCQIVLTNPTSSRKSVEVLTQIPNGALPVLNGYFTRSQHFLLEPFSTQTAEFFFYFPFPGNFSHYPVHVSEDDTMLSTTSPFVFKVVDELTNYDRTSWPYVSQYSSSEEVLDYLEHNNIERLDLELIAFRLKNKEFFEAVYKLLKKRFKYNATVWSYGLYHKNTEAVKEFLENSSIANQCGASFDSEILYVNPITRHFYQHKEYWPLVNARIYPIGKKREILNDHFSKQYTAFLNLIKYHKELTDYDRLALVYYLVLQDRTEEAQNWFKEIADKKLCATIQYKYMSAYLAFSEEKPDNAVKIARELKDYPVVRWQNLFRDVIAQAAEIKGEKNKVKDIDSREQKLGVLADSQPNLEFKVENRLIKLNYANINSVKVNYYLMDLELLFSRKPFVQQVSSHFSVIQPNYSTSIELPVSVGTKTIKVPEQFKDSNVMIEVSSNGVVKTAAYYPNSLSINIAEQYGQLRIADEVSGGPISRAYIKVYARLKNGQVTFYKDGYTDLRGKFDYASLSTNQLDNVERFAILIISDTNGSIVREAAPPPR